MRWFLLSLLLFAATPGARAAEPLVNFNVVLLQPGSLPSHDDQEIVARLVGGEAGDAPATLTELLGAEPAWDDLVAALAAGWRTALGVALQPSALTAAEQTRATELEQHYAGPAWTWHR